MSGSESGLALTATSSRCPVFHGPAVGLRAMKFLGVLADVVGDQAQRQFPQGASGWLREKNSPRPPRRGRPCTPCPGRAAAAVRREAESTNSISAASSTLSGTVSRISVPGDLAHGVGAAVDVLDVQRGEHVDARVQQFLDVLPALGVARAGGVGVRQFVDQRQPGLARQHRVQVHLGELDAAMFHRLSRHERQAARSARRFPCARAFRRSRSPRPRPAASSRRAASSMA